MIVSNQHSRYGSYARLHTSGFDCTVSTAPGLFKGSTLVKSVRPDGIVQVVPVAKAYLKRSLSKAERDAVHDYLVGMLDQLGNDELYIGGVLNLFGNDQTRLINVIGSAFSVAKARGLILDYIVGNPGPRLGA
jgi:hypothetical protein